MKIVIKIAALTLCFLSIQSRAQSVTNNDDELKTSNQQKKNLTPEDYKLWNSVSREKISNNGDWCAYSIRNSGSKEQTQFVKATKTSTKYDFPFGASSQFSEGSKWFGCLVPKKGMALLNLENGTTQWIKEVSEFKFLDNGRYDKYLIAFRKSIETSEKTTLLIMDLTTGTQINILGVKEYKIDPASHSLAYIIDTKGKKSVVFHALEDTPSITSITNNTLYTYNKLRWSKNGAALTFMQEAPEDPEMQKRHKLYYFNTKQGLSKLKCLDPTINPSLFEGMDIMEKSLKISDDGTAVFFDVVSKEILDKTVKSSLPVNVEVWNTKDKLLYPKLKSNQIWGQLEFGAWKAAWWPLKDKTMVLETKKLPEVVVNANGTYMLSYNSAAYAPHFKRRGDIDLYLTNLETGERFLFLKQQVYGKFSHSFHVVFSPSGKYINYFRDKHWWFYDLEKKTHTNVTKGLGVQLYQTEHDGAHPGGLEPFSGKGSHESLFWTNEDKELIIYDRYDVWLVSPKGKAHKITQGKEKQVRYRIHKPFYKSKVLNPSQGLVLKTFGTTDISHGIAVWKPKKGTDVLINKNMYISNFVKAKNREAYIYKEQSFDTSPRIKYCEKGMSVSKTLVDPNPQQEQFYWGQSELIHYTDPVGQPLQGALFYPANYIQGKKYPMIVSIYEILTDKLHSYVAPSKDSENGFNRRNYTDDGYLVFLPDIKYKFNDPGVSAVNCIEAGVKAVSAKGIVEKDYIGLVGHSFGGYQTAFVVTQTNMFAAAVAGSALTDLVSFYHGIGAMNISNANWFEDHQHRFTDSFYQNPEAYFRNSPLHYISNVDTPLLLWAGKLDNHVDWHQSIELYSALRRLDKECTMLLYPDEGHSIYKNRENAIDLTSRMKTWFDKYLKPDRALKKL